MKAKTRDYRKLQRARNRFNKALKEGSGYADGLMYIQLHMMSVSRWFFNKYPKPLPKITYKK